MTNLTALKNYKEENKELNKQLKKLILAVKKQKDRQKQTQLYQEIKATLDGMSETSRKIYGELMKMFE
jgi:hypothetical protein